jgi:hypothetical protein
MSIAPIPLFDPAELRRRTLGNPALETEVLALFSVELERLMRQLEAAADNQTRSERLRAIIALARDTGAARLLHDARLAEAHVGAGAADLQPLRDAAAQTLSFVQGSYGGKGQGGGA